MMQPNRIILAFSVIQSLPIAFAVDEEPLASIESIPFIQEEGGSVIAKGVSGDGRTVFGFGRPLGEEERGEAFVWYPDEGVMGLGDFPANGGADEIVSIPWRASFDGRYVVGSSTVDEGADEAFLWTEEEGMVGLGDLEGGWYFSQAKGVSGDGTVVVGWSESDRGSEPFIWTSGDGLQSFGTLPEGSHSGIAWDISDDGEVIVGQAMNAEGDNEAFVWTEETGMVGKGDLPGETFSSRFLGVSGNGKWAVGSGESANGRQALAWSQDTGLVALGDLPDGAVPGRYDGFANDVSNRGIVVGLSETVVNDDYAFTAFIWDRMHGMRELKKVLVEDYGVNLEGGTLNGAEGISNDGRFIVGSGRNPEGRSVAWRVEMPTLLTDGHIDFSVLFEDEMLRLGVHDDMLEMNFEAHQVAFGIPRYARYEVSSDEAFAFLGEVGSTYWLLPQFASPGEVFLGVEAGSISQGVFENNEVFIELESVDGPGEFHAYSVDGFGTPELMMSSADGIAEDDRMLARAGSHFHVNWAFTAPGLYRVGFRPVAHLQSTGEEIRGDVATFIYKVQESIHYAPATHFTFETFEVSGATETLISDIRNDGVLVGRYLDQKGISQGFIQEGEMLTTFNVTGTTATFPGGINDHGQVVGFYRNEVNLELQRGFIREADGTVTTIDVSEESTVYAWRINNAGQINGYWFEDEPFFIRSYQRSPEGEVTVVVFDGSPMGTVARGMNENGTLTGWKWDENFSLQGVIWDDGTFVEEFAIEGWDNTLPGDINASGDVAGTVNNAFVTTAGFFRRADGVTSTFTPPGAAGIEVFGLNDNGIVVGAMVDAAGRRKGFLANPAIGLHTGLVDLGLAFEEGSFDLHLHDEASETELRPTDAVIVLSPSSEQAISDTALATYLGESERSIWILPQFEDSNLPFLGIGAEKIENGIFVGDIVQLELVSVVGGDVFLFSEDGVENLEMHFNSSDGLLGGDVLMVEVGSHRHATWAFSKPGSYRIGVQAKGTLVEGNELVEGDIVYYAFEVPQPLRTQPEDPDPDVPVLARGEVEVGLAYEDGELRLHIHDHQNGEEHASDEVTLQVLPLSQGTVPSASAFSFLGEPGAPIWLLPQNENPQLLFLGLAAQEVGNDVFENNALELHLRNVEGPGDIFLYATDGFGAPHVFWNSQDGIDESDVKALAVGGHEHINWGFSAPGTYRITIEASGTLEGSDEILSTGLKTLVLEVIPIKLDLEIERADDGGVLLRLATQEGILYQLETSLNLVDWDESGAPIIGDNLVRELRGLIQEGELYYRFVTGSGRAQ